MANEQRLRFIRRKEVSRLTGLSRSYLCELESAGRFPRSVKIARRAVAYIESEVIAWIEARAAQRDVCLGGKARARLDAAA